MLHFLSFAENVRDVFLGIASMIYYLLEQAAQLFFDVSVVELLDNATISAIYQRVGLILGLFMLFKLTFSFIQMVVDPDQMTDKNNGIGSVIKKLVVVVLLLGMTPTIFKWGFDLQEALIKDQTIGKIILGDQVKESGEIGRSFSANLYSSFVDDESKDEFQQGLLSNDESTRLNYGDIKDYMSDTSMTGIGAALFCLIVGGIALWMFLTYTISTATRVVQLMFLELIAPIPIISYISSKKENAFQAWIKQCASTYLDLFIRMFIFYIAILMIQLIMSNDTGNTIYSTVGLGSPSSPMFLVYIMLILGVLLFMKKAPQLIEELFPGLKSKASLGFGIGTKEGAGKIAFSALRRPAGAALGAVAMGYAGAATRMFAKGMDNDKRNKKPLNGMLRAGLTGAGAGLVRGATAGFMSKKGVAGGISKNSLGKVTSGNRAWLNNEENNYTRKERWEDALAKKFGFQSYTQKLKNDKIGYEGAKNGIKMLEDYHTLAKQEADDKLETGEYMKADFDSGDGLKVRTAAIEAIRLRNLAASYTDQNSSIYKDHQAKLSSIDNDKKLTDAEKKTKKEELTAEFTREQMQASYEADEAKKTYEKEYVTFTTSDNAGGATNHRLKSELKLTQQKIETHNKAYEGVPDAQIEYKLTNDFRDLDDFKKGKGKYADGGTEKGARQIKQNADAKLQEIDFAIKERELKQNGNNQGGNGGK